MPRRGSLEPTAVTSTADSPAVTRIEPEACFARRPVSMVISRPPMEMVLRMTFMCDGTFPVRVDYARSVDPSWWDRPRTSVMWGENPELLPDSELRDQLGVALRRLRLEVVEHPATLADDLQEAPAGVEVLRV